MRRSADRIIVEGRKRWLVVVPAGLLVPEGVKGIGPGGTARREIARQERHGTEKDGQERSLIP